MKNLKSGNIIIIVLFASIGYVVFPTIIKYESIQYSSLPEKISIKVFDEAKGDSAIFNLAVVSKLPIDSLKEKDTRVSGIPGKNILYHVNPVFIVWAMLVSVMITIAAGSFPVFIGQIMQLKTRFHLKPKQVRTAIGISIGIGLLLVISNLYSPGYYRPPMVIDDFHILLKHGSVLKWIEVTTVLLVFPAMIVIFLTGICSDNITVIKVPDAILEAGNNPEDQAGAKLVQQSKNSIETAADNFDFLNQLLRNALQLLAIVVVFSVLTSGVLGKAINAVLEIKGMEIYPSQISYVYGMFFSLFLAVVYVPVFMYLKYRYNQLKDSIVKIEEAEIIKDEKWFQSVWTRVKFDGSALDNFKVALTVLAPLISSFLPDSLHFFK